MFNQIQTRQPGMRDVWAADADCARNLTREKGHETQTGFVLRNPNKVISEHFCIKFRFLAQGFCEKVSSERHTQARRARIEPSFCKVVPLRMYMYNFLRLVSTLAITTHEPRCWSRRRKMLNVTSRWVGLAPTRTLCPLASTLLRRPHCRL